MKPIIIRKNVCHDLIIIELVVTYYDIDRICIWINSYQEYSKKLKKKYYKEPSTNIISSIDMLVYVFSCLWFICVVLLIVEDGKYKRLRIINTCELFMSLLISVLIYFSIDPIYCYVFSLIFYFDYVVWNFWNTLINTHITKRDNVYMNYRKWAKIPKLLIYIIPLCVILGLFPISYVYFSIITCSLVLILYSEFNSINMLIRYVLHIYQIFIIFYNSNWIMNIILIGYINCILLFEKIDYYVKKKNSLYVKPITINELLNNNKCRTLFKKYLISIHCVESILFWERSMDYKTMCNNNTYNIEQLLNEARDIEQQFIVNGSPEEINISYLQRNNIRNNILYLDTYIHNINLLRQHRALLYNIFDASQQEIIELLFNEPYKLFMTHVQLNKHVFQKLNMHRDSQRSRRLFFVSRESHDFDISYRPNVSSTIYDNKYSDFSEIKHKDILQPVRTPMVCESKENPTLHIDTISPMSSNSSNITSPIVDPTIELISPNSIDYLSSPSNITLPHSINESPLIRELVTPRDSDIVEMSLNREHVIPRDSDNIEIEMSLNRELVIPRDSDIVEMSLNRELVIHRDSDIIEMSLNRELVISCDSDGTTLQKS
jgi:hypothetical protein